MTVDEAPALCDFCRNRLPDAPVTLEYDGETYRLCTRACREAFADADSVFTSDDGHKRVRPGVAGLDTALPQGLPRNSFVVLEGHPGTRIEAIQAELVWRTLQRGEPAILVAYTEPPISVVENFLAMDWNVLPALEDGRLVILDCFTYRVDGRDRLYERLTPWNRHLDSLATPATAVVRDPADASEFRNKLDNRLEALEMVETGLVAIDSLVEFASLVAPRGVYEVIKDVRAEVSKGRFVPVIAGATHAGEDDFPRDLTHVVDGVVDLRLDESLVEDTLLRRLRVRKMRGVLTIAEWHTYEVTSGLGLVTFDPRAEIEASELPDDGGESDA